MKDTSNAKHLCRMHPEYPIGPLPSIADEAVLKATTISNSLRFEPVTLRRTFNDDVLYVEDPSALKGINYKGRYYDIECLECFKTVIEKRVAIDYLKLLRDTGKLTLEAYNEYIDLSVSKPLTQEEFDSLIKYI